jgi:hypothetical protein
MKKTLKLRNPILINGKSVDSMDYDIDEITGELFAMADAKKMSASGMKSGNLSGAAEIDYSFQLYLGYAAIIAVNPSYDWSDLARIKGHDNMEVMRIGRSFITGSEASQEDDSEEPTETTEESSQPQLQTSKKSE